MLGKHLVSLRGLNAEWANKYFGVQEFQLLDLN